MHRLWLLFLIFPTYIVQAQSTQADLSARLLNKVVFLRGLYAGDDLRFDANGLVVGAQAVTSPTLAGFRARRIQMKSNGLQLEGERIGLKFQNEVADPMAIGAGNGPGVKDRRVRILIAAPAGNDYTSALDTIFTAEFAELAALSRPEWQPYMRRRLTPEQVAKLPPLDIPKQRPSRGSPGDQHPVPIETHEPQFSEEARIMKFAGNTTLSLTVEKTGTVSHAIIVRPAGLGLDEEAVDCVQQYRFSPAMRDGEPVAVNIQYVVNFQIF